MKRHVLAAVVLVAGAATAASGQNRPAWGRIAVFGNGSTTTRDGGSDSSFSEWITNVTFESATGDDVSYEYRADLRLAGYGGDTARPRRTSIYDAYAGVRLMGGRVRVRGGQMWLTELGGLGSVAGGLLEFRRQAGTAGRAWRAAVFGGLEPRVMDAGYEDQVLKVGALFAYEGAGMRRHVLGFVHLRDHGITERSVLSFTNYVPVYKRLYFYQAGEYDLAGPGIASGGSLTYFFVNGRYVANQHLEFQGLFHRGRSIDQRSIIRDQLDGRPVDPKALDGMRFESVTGRVTVTLTRRIRLFGGIGQDRNNRDDQPSARVTFGGFVTNVLASGIDLTFSDSRMSRGSSGSYDSWYLSLGRAVGSHVYLTGDYSSSLSVYRFTSATGFVIESRPATRRASVSGLIHAARGTSLHITAERVLDSDATQTRIMSGITYRF